MWTSCFHAGFATHWRDDESTYIRYLECRRLGCGIQRGPDPAKRRSGFRRHLRVEQMHAVMYSSHLRYSRAMGKRWLLLPNLKWRWLTKNSTEKIEKFMNNPKIRNFR